jgi:S-adenosylmethionine hydrolase
MSIITLTTDFGQKDHYVGGLKGKIISEFNEALIVDISHYVDAFNISEASYIIDAAYSSFPKNTVHIIGVDIEMSAKNKHIAIQWNDHYFVAADNGILSILTQKIKPQKMVEINIQNRFSSDFSDLDVFVKVACHLAKGGLLNVIGKEIETLKPVTDLQPSLSEDGKTLKGNIVYIDHYGNAVTNISKKLFHETAKGRLFEISFKNKNIKTIYTKYSDIENTNVYFVGEKLAIFNDVGLLEIAIYKGSPFTGGTANSLLGLNYRDVVSIEFR